MTARKALMSSTKPTFDDVLLEELMENDGDSGVELENAGDGDTSGLQSEDSDSDLDIEGL